MAYLKVTPQRSLGRTMVLSPKPMYAGFGRYERKRLPWYSYPGIHVVKAEPLYQGFRGFGEASCMTKTQAAVYGALGLVAGVGVGYVVWGRRSG